jgi:hypothetical protein
MDEVVNVDHTSTCKSRTKAQPAKVTRVSDTGLGSLCTELCPVQAVRLRIVRIESYEPLKACCGRIPLPRSIVEGPGRGPNLPAGEVD